jgi:uncharacterized protein YndB with AHSA1/START domain
VDHSIGPQSYRLHEGIGTSEKGRWGVGSEGGRSSLGCNDKQPLRRFAMPGTVRLHRVLRTKPEKVYRAFLEADAVARWLPPNGFTCTVDKLEARVGGTFRMSFRNFGTGTVLAFGGSYLELVPGQKIRHTDKFDDANLPGEVVTTITLREVSVGTEINVLQEGLPDAIPTEACYLGWQESLKHLARLVEPEIPG